MKYTESLSRAELTRFVRFYVLRSGPVRFMLFLYVVMTGVGIGALLTGDRFFAGMFVFMVSLGLLGGIVKLLWGFRDLKVYSQSQYPQEFNFSEKGISVRNATGLYVEIPWRLVRRIYAGREYTYFATTAGTYWVHKLRFAEHLNTVQKLWRESRAPKRT